MANQLTANAVVVQGLLTFHRKAIQKLKDEKLKITYCRFKVAHKEINRAGNKSLGVLLLRRLKSDLLNPKFGSQKSALL